MSFGVFVDTGPTSIEQAQKKDSWLKPDGKYFGPHPSREAAEAVLDENSQEICTGRHWLTIRELDANGKPLPE